MRRVDQQRLDRIETIPIVNLIIRLDLINVFEIFVPSKHPEGRRHDSLTDAGSIRASTRHSASESDISTPDSHRRTVSNTSDGQQRPPAPSNVHAKLQTPPPSSSRQELQTEDHIKDPLGLTTLHTPEGEREVDIVFLHGLGGTSRQTWCHGQDIDKFWPQLWLPLDLPTARVLTFGYNANYNATSEWTATGIGDFATDFLFRMKYTETTPERLGQVPIIIVAHSMGGLVFKKAFAEGHSGDQYKSIVSMIKGVVFLATPHRGSDLAKYLDRFQQACSWFGRPSRKYITELAQKSLTSNEIDEAFRRYASKLRVFSFYEALLTRLAPLSSALIVTRESVTLGLPDEEPISLNADHFDMCKFTSPTDPNYVSVLAALQEIVPLPWPAPVQGVESLEEDIPHLADLLGIAGPPDEDLASHRAISAQGTCRKFIRSTKFDEWLRAEQKTVLRAHAGPGTGKTIVSSAVVDHMNGAGHDCSYYSFKFEHRREHPLASIHHAFQVARKKMSVMETPLPDNQDDIRLSVADQLGGLVCEDQRKLELVEEIVARSQGSFLWASLVGQAVVGKTRDGQIQQALESTPSGMDRLYDRMMATIIALNMDEDKQLAKALITCAMFAKTPITVGEFSELYPSETKGIVSFRHAVDQICGQFVILTHDERVQLVHHSAREYLMRTKEAPFLLDPRGANEDTVVKCLGALCDKTLRQKVTTLNPPEFPQYSSTFWPDHLQEVAVDSARVLKALVTFFNGPYPLTWIQYLAKTSRLSELPVASRKLSEFLQKYTKADGPESMLSRRLEDVSLLQSWAVDLMMLPAKFGPYLLVDPTSIYKHIPALCPMACAINQKFSAGPDARLAVSGLSGGYWGDCPARISPGGDTIRRLAVSSLYLAVASQTIISIYGTVLYEERSIIASEGNILDLAFNNSGSLLAVCTATRTTVYTTSGWSLILCTENPRFCGAAIELSLTRTIPSLRYSAEKRFTSYRFMIRPRTQSGPR
ncbi:hypothetical protein RB600_008063 [Gaeumannomyces tritici]